MTETESQQNLEALRSCIKELDAIRAAVPDEFKSTGRPLPEMVAELAQSYRELQEQLGGGVKSYVDELTDKIVGRISKERPYGGDDIAPIIREELALAFAPAIQVNVSQEEFDELRKQWADACPLTAARMVFVPETK